LEGEHHYWSYFLGTGLVVIAFFWQRARSNNGPLPANLP